MGSWNLYDLNNLIYNLTIVNCFYVTLFYFLLVAYVVLIVFFSILRMISFGIIYLRVLFIISCLFQYSSMKYFLFFKVMLYEYDYNHRDLLWRFLIA